MWWYKPLFWTLNPSTREAEARQSGLHTDFKDSQTYEETVSQKKKENQKPESPYVRERRGNPYQYPHRTLISQGQPCSHGTVSKKLSNTMEPDQEHMRLSNCWPGSQQEGLPSRNSQQNRGTGAYAAHAILNKQLQDPKGSCRRTRKTLWPLGTLHTEKGQQYTLHQ